MAMYNIINTVYVYCLELKRKQKLHRAEHIADASYENVKELTDKWWTEKN